MNKYYYLVASLPYLNFTDKPLFNKTVFISECKKWLSPADMEVVLSADILYQTVTSQDTDLIREWKSFNMRLRDKFLEIRTARKTGASYRISDRLKEIVEQPNPLLMEIKFEKVRWDFLEQKGREYFFDVSWLTIYFLKLQILQRLATFDKDEGEKFFYNLCEVRYEETVGAN